MRVLFLIPCDSLTLSPVTYPSATLIGAYGCRVVAMLLPYRAPLGSNWAPSGLQEATARWQTGLATCPTSPFKWEVRNARSVAARTVCHTEWWVGAPIWPHATVSFCTCRVGVIWADSQIVWQTWGYPYCTSSLSCVCLAVQMKTSIVFTYFCPNRLKSWFGGGTGMSVGPQGLWCQAWLFVAMVHLEN